MNKSQKIAIGIGALAALVALLVAPYSKGSYQIGYRFIFLPPDHGSINYGQVLMTVLAVLIVTAGAVWLLRDTPGNAKPTPK